MNSDIILRIKSNYGFNRIEISREEKLGNLKRKISTALKLADHQCFTIQLDHAKGTLIT